MNRFPCYRTDVNKLFLKPCLISFVILILDRTCPSLRCLLIAWILLILRLKLSYNSHRGRRKPEWPQILKFLSFIVFYVCSWLGLVRGRVITFMSCLCRRHTLGRRRCVFVRVSGVCCPGFCNIFCETRCANGSLLTCVSPSLQHSFYTAGTGLGGGTSLAKSRMSSLELAHQCLMVWNTLIAFRKLDMSPYMEDTSCLLRKKMIPHSHSGPQPQSPASATLQERQKVANLGLDCPHCMPLRRHTPAVGVGPCPLQRLFENPHSAELSLHPGSLLLRFLFELPEGESGGPGGLEFCRYIARSEIH